MRRSIKRILALASSAAIAAMMITAPVTVNAAYTPIIAGDTVKNEWKFDFRTGSTENGFTHVKKTAHPVMGDLETGMETGYGFVGTWKDDFNFNGRYDGLTMVKGHVTNLLETANGIGSTGSEPGTNGFEYPLRFGLNTKEGTYFRVRAVLTNLEDGKDATDVTLWTERKHPVVSHDTIKAGESLTLEFSVDVEPNYFEKSDPKGIFHDDMLNMVLAGENVALKTLEIQEVEAGTTLWVLGDSTVTDGGSSIPYFELNNYTGVGSGLSKFIRKDIAISNQGEGGLAAGDNYHFNVAKERIKRGDYMYVEYGHNHKNDGVAGYLNNIKKYYDACKTAGATLVLVGPIDRHNNYNSATNTWSTSLAQFSRAAKGYVDTMMYGGETKAATFVSTYASGGEDAAMAIRDQAVKDANGTAAVNNVAFIDLNQPSLDWFGTISKSGTIEGKEVTNDSRLVDYYFQTSKGGSTDGTHPNDAGAEALAEFFYRNAAQKIKEYPALTKLLQTYDNTTPADNETPSGRHWKPLTASPLNSRVYVEKAGGAGWTDAVSVYSEPLKIRQINFNDDGKLASMEVQVQDNNIMPSYGRGIVAMYDANGKLVKTAISNADETSVENGLAGWVDNSTGIGVQTLAFDGSDLNESDGVKMKAFIWSMEDKEGYPITMRPYTDGKYDPVTFDYLLVNDSLSGPEDFHYYGLKADNTFTDKNNWKISNISAVSKSENNEETWYGKFTGSGSMSHDLSSSRTSGIVEISGRVRNAKGVKIKLGDNNSSLEGINIDGNGAVSDGSGNALGNSGADWTAFAYTFDMDRGVAYASFGETKGAEYKIEAYESLVVDKLKPYPISKVTLEGSTADFELTDFTVKSVVRQEELAKYSVTGAYTTGCSSEMGEIIISKTSVPQGGAVTLKAKAAAEHLFEGWYSSESGSDADLISVKQTLDIRVPSDTTIYAKFKYSEGMYFFDDFEKYDAGTKIAQTGSSDGSIPAPDPVDLGALVLYAGTRNNGSVDGKSYISVDETADKKNKYMVCSSGSTANSGRGVKFLFANEFDISQGTFVLEFDTKLDGSGMKLIGKALNDKKELVDNEIAAYTAVNTAGLSSGEWVNVKLVFDAASNTKYFIVTDASGKVVNMESSSYKAIALTGATFYDAGSGSVAIDNMRFYKAGAPDTTGNVPQDVTINAPAKTTVKVGTLPEVTTNDEGTATIKLVEGKYDVTATNAAYKTYTGVITVDSTRTVTIAMESGEAVTLTVNYLDTEGNAIKDAETITEGLFKGEAYTLDDNYTSMIRKNRANDSLQDLYIFNAAETGSLTISALEETNAIDLKFDYDGAYIEYEDFDSITGTWGFTAGKSGSVSVSGGRLGLSANKAANKEHTDTKVLDSAISSSKKLTVKFDFTSDVGGSGRSTLFNLLDSNDNYIFSLMAKSGGGVYYGLNAAAGETNKVGGANDLYSVVVTMDFEAKTIQGTITDKTDGKVTAIDETSITDAINLAKLTAGAGYSAGGVFVDNFGFRDDSINN